MLLDGGGSSSKPLQGKGPLKPAPKQGSSIEEWMKRPSTPADQVVRESAPKGPVGPNPHYDVPAWQNRWEQLNSGQPATEQPVTGWGNSRGGPRGDYMMAQQHEETEAERAKRAEILGITTGALTTTPELIKDMTHRMTREEYDALSDKQRAAVDFNTSLAKAVRRDLRLQDKSDPSKEERKNYDAASESMFGKDHGSEIYAPETMALLRQLKVKDTADDLDDYLGLKVAITEDDLVNFDTGPAEAGAVIDGRVPEAVRPSITYKQHLVDSAQEALQAQLAKGAKLLQDHRSTLATSRRSDIEDMGGVYKPVTAMTGFGSDNLDRMVSGTFDELLGYDKKKISDSLQLMRENLPEDQVKAFFDYADRRTREAQQYNIELTPSGQTDKSYTPEQTRKLLGLKK
jgi:hypothetical protein